MDYYLGVWKKYAVFDGRARRKEYWLFSLGNFIVALILDIIGGLILAATQSSIFGMVIDYILVFGYAIAAIIPSIAVSVRRLHDIGRSGAWLFIGFIPLIGAIILLVFFCQDSQPGDNQYGPNPKGASAIPQNQA